MEPGRPGQRLEAEFQFLGLGHRGRGLGQKRIPLHLSVKFGSGAECPQRGGGWGVGDTSIGPELGIFI